MDIAKAHQQVLAKSVKDPAFRASLLKDANAALEKELGVKAPAGFKVKVVEDSASVVHLVLPPVLSKELSEGDLGKVSGGAACANSTANGPVGPCYNSTRPGY